jgi:hypothetical protein
MNENELMSSSFSSVVYPRPNESISILNVLFRYGSFHSENGIQELEYGHAAMTNVAGGHAYRERGELLPHTPVDVLNVATIPPQLDHVPNSSVQG